MLILINKKLQLYKPSWPLGDTKFLAGRPTYRVVAQPGWPSIRPGSPGAAPTAMLLHKRWKSCRRSPGTAHSTARSRPRGLLSLWWSGSYLVVLGSSPFAHLPCPLAGWLLADDSSSYEASY